ncbi:ATP-grasp peptide maturase system methyltransferase [Streptomonospora sp. S1-112]|uniref:Protein-L-isoaspartate O-methyltransferase n=1 Tax=Streptomonospora mangrovi TaxID=2883123 RepID=A0A9X3NNA3_9ACTN|nr:ATP-grasp peptide maturase system methyltransferase [Streptomonospora mangrovi]MDA0565263.1 ATP-grasp peptide maturase system methyltransferase [Streptomonospora mangrovi]
MTDFSDARTALLRRALADELERAGVLRSPRWRRAVERVPRHLFVPEFFERADTPGRGTLWAPVSGGRDTARWLGLAYRNETWVTQLDGHVAPRDVAEPVGGDPTSSSTVPGLVVRMLEHLDLDDDATVLEIGTGSGYSTALMCDRLGDDKVTSVEVDPAVAAGAAAALRRAGHAPRLVIGDGLDGAPAHAPYDRVIATCSVRRVPRAWLDQTRPGGRILVTVSGWLHGYGLALLEVGADGTAEGRFLPGTVSFMIARPQAAPPVNGERWDEVVAALAGVRPRPAVVPPDLRDDWTGAFVMQLGAPGAQWRSRRGDGGPWVEYFFDAATGAAASLTPEPGGGWAVRQIGPVRLWDGVEAAVRLWRDAGSPPQERFRIRTDGHTQTVWVTGGDTTATWDLAD